MFTGSAAARRHAVALALACYFAGVYGTMAAAFEWESATPESQGMSSTRLDALRIELASRATNAFLVIRNDKIVYEWYADGHPADEKRWTASLAKALVGGVSLAVAMTDGKIALDDPAAKFVSAWANDEQKSRITIRHLGSHTSGMSSASTPGVQHEEQPGWRGEFWRRLPSPRDPFTIARDDVPITRPVGEEIQYSDPGIGMLAYCVTAALQADEPRPDEPRDIRTLLRDRVLRPIGVADREWSCGYGQTFEVDGLSLVAPWGGGAFTPRAAARIGRLLLAEGQWDGRPILSPESVRDVTSDAGLPGRCGMGFWTNGDGRYPKLPRDVYYGAGASDQLLVVIPSLKLIMVRNGGELAPPADNVDDVRAAFHDERAKILFEPLVDAVTDRRENDSQSRQAPYPPSQAIVGLRWAPPETIVRQAAGSDNWPLTWADDDLLYTAYGDGNGFDPPTPEKLSLGLARIEGAPPQFRGVNLRSPSIERRGDGPAGRKASGMLMVDGTLYLWTRNAGNSQLASSSDHGQSWQGADWKFTASFGCPSFLNFGPNYAGARDEFVYVYSPDVDSAYEIADQLVLARVPRDQVLQRDAYEFYAGLDVDGLPRWSPNMADRQAAFLHPQGCYRTSASYHPALRRYLLVQTIPPAPGQTDMRRDGGLGVYEAPQPWGPWSTAYFTRDWDVGPGESASFPPKWFDSAGRTLYLVFSGDDSFSVRRCDLTLADSRPSPGRRKDASSLP